MKGLRAALGKDLRLIRNGTGLFCLLLPLVLLLALRAAGGELLGRAYLEPFPIAVRDEDGTLMSRSLISQMGEVELFSQIVLAEDESDEALLESGCAAVITIPKDFFYTLYDMRENTVQVALNDGMPLESALFRSIFSSVMEIVSADQAAGRAVFRSCCGELSPEQERELWSVTSRQLIQDALGRLTLPFYARRIPAPPVACDGPKAFGDVRGRGRAVRPAGSGFAVRRAGWIRLGPGRPGRARHRRSPGPLRPLGGGACRPAVRPGGRGGGGDR